MTIEHLALAIGAFLIMLIWILRSMDARLRKMQKELEEFHISHNRLFMAAMMQKGEKFPAEVISLVPPSNPVEAEQHTYQAPRSLTKDQGGNDRPPSR